MSEKTWAAPAPRKRSFWKDLVRDKYLILMILPVIIIFFLYNYLPMLWNIIAFEKYSIRKGIFGSQWVGLKHFEKFFNSPYCVRVIRNTFVISFTDLILGWPVPIIFALLLNEVKNVRTKRIIQTCSYLPHFISVVVVVGMMRIFFHGSNGIVNKLILHMGGEAIPFFSRADCFVPLYVFSGMWQNFGWDSIIYFSAISSIDPEIYEAAIVDGAGRWRKMFSVTLPSIAPTVITLLILRIGWLMSVGFEKIILMYNEATYETADVISTYVYRVGLLNADFSYGTAIGLFNCLVSVVLLVSANFVSKKLTETSIF